MNEFLEAYIEFDPLTFEESDLLSDYDLLREALSPEYSDMSDEEIDNYLGELFSDMSPEEIEGFLKSLKSFGKSVLPVAAKILPVAGTVVGTAFGGPLGGTLGTALGGVAGKALAGLGRGPRVATGPTSRPQAPVPAGGTSAVGQLMGLIQNPAFLQSLLGKALGSAGRSAVPVGKSGTSAPFGAFMNALSQLATQATIEANASEGNMSQTPEYLLDESGDFLCEDVSIPEQRAEVLLEHLRETFYGDLYENQVGELHDVIDWLNGYRW